MSRTVWKSCCQPALLVLCLTAPVSAAGPPCPAPSAFDLGPVCAVPAFVCPITVPAAQITAPFGSSVFQPALINNPAQLVPRSNSAMVGMQVLIVLWIFLLGACFGSFLNVVIYRLPAGLSLGRPKSRCPRCETPLSARDNVPILGWLMLRGKCRYCQVPISPRYPLVEFTCGAVLLALMFGELLNGAANLPVRHPDHFSLHSGFWLAWFAKWDLSGMYVYHCCLLIVSLATLMIGHDGHRPQWRLLTFGLVVGLLAGTMWLELRPVAAFPWPDFLYEYRLGFVWGDRSPGGDAYWTGVTLIGLLDGLIGTVMGFVVGRGLQFAIGYRASHVGATVGSAVCATLTLGGAFFGWQGAVMLAMVCLPVLVLIRLAARLSPTAVRQLPPVIFLTLLAFLLCWARLDQSGWFIGIEGFAGSSLLWWQDWLIAVALLAVACGIVGVLPSFREAELGAALHAATADDMTAVSSVPESGRQSSTARPSNAQSEEIVVAADSNEPPAGAESHDAATPVSDEQSDGTGL